VELHKIAVLLEYDGTGFKGYQSQAAGRTVQGVVESAIVELVGVATRVHAASRTDAGVHACGQVISFWVENRFGPEVVARGLNHYLPGDVAVKGVCVLDGDFDVRRRAVARCYRYLIGCGVAHSPLRERYQLFVSESPDVQSMRLAARSLQGVHDFASFATSLDEPESTVRVVHEARVTEHDDVVEFSIVANAFLRHQVRNTVGQLLRVGLGRCSVEEFAELVAHPRRGTAGPAAPGRGLCLTEVRYQPSLPFAA
jgi:tRNA pseudouridine38-40 synthase